MLFAVHARGFKDVTYFFSFASYIPAMGYTRSQYKRYTLVSEEEVPESRLKDSICCEIDVCLSLITFFALIQIRIPKQALDRDLYSLKRSDMRTAIHVPIKMNQIPKIIACPARTCKFTMIHATELSSPSVGNQLDKNILMSAGSNGSSGVGLLKSQCFGHFPCHTITDTIPTCSSAIRRDSILMTDLN